MSANGQNSWPPPGSFPWPLSAVFARWLNVLPAQLRGRLVLTSPTIGLDATDIEVFGHAKERIGWN